jgi:2-polyprenyl-6-methoxyphenol hydroxylase-like FAD-dependent oxidoreductase
MENLDVVVVGAGIGGLSSALALARNGHRVTLVERDDTPMPDSPEAAFEWDRKGAPQVRHPHVFLGLARVILRDRFPDVLQALSDLGIEPGQLGSGQGGDNAMDEATRAVLEADDDLRMLPCRRTTFEWVMRRTVLAEPGITLRLGEGVAGVELEGNVVTGVRLEGGDVLSCDLVVATTGRRGDVPMWLAKHGIEVTETASDAGVVYFSRFYRLDHDEAFGFRAGFGAGIGAGVIGSDAGTYSITAVVDKNDKELRDHLNDSARFDATMSLLPELADVASAGGTPINQVHCMTGLLNRTRTYTSPDGTPLVIGLMACGDAHTCTNPAYGRGQSLALKMAVMIADALSTHEDLESAARDYEAACVEQVVPWYQFSVLTDQMRAAAGVRPGSGPSASDPFAALFGGGGSDPEVVRLVMRVMNLLELPSALMAKLPELQANAAKRFASAPAEPAVRVRRPSRADLLAVVA